MTEREWHLATANALGHRAQGRAAAHGLPVLCLAWHVELVREGGGLAKYGTIALSSAGAVIWSARACIGSERPPVVRTLHPAMMARLEEADFVDLAMATDRLIAMQNARELLRIAAAGQVRLTDERRAELERAIASATRG